MKSDSDCEIIIPLYKKYGLKKTLEELDGSFFFVLYDNNTNIFYAARDHLGVETSFIGFFCYYLIKKVTILIITS